VAGDARGDDDAGACERLPHDGPDRRAGQRPKRGPTAHKDLAIRTRRSPALSVRHYSLADIVGEGEGACPAGLAGSKGKAPIRPIDIVEAERDHVLSAEAKTRQEEEYGAGAHTDGAPIVLHGQHLFNVLWRQA
jgi:hypothetical protein